MGLEKGEGHETGLEESRKGREGMWNGTEGGKVA